jgi:hypothetical protein
VRVIVIAGEEASDLTGIDAGQRIGREHRPRHGVSNW